MIAIIDYGMGNLRSVQKALERVGAKTLVTQNPKEIQSAEKVVLPGVGAMQPAMDKLAELNLIESIKVSIKSGKPFLGICLGLQLLFDNSSEGGSVQGLGILKGNVERFTQLKVPHMGWNQLKITNKNCALFEGISHGSNFYFCHSYFVQPADSKLTVATTEYGIDFACAVGKDNIFGVQFHPEKSQDLGLKVLRNFVEIKG